MTQPQTVTTAQLQQMQASINAGGVDAAEHVYSTLYEKGYNYAGWDFGSGYRNKESIKEANLFWFGDRGLLLHCIMILLIICWCRSMGQKKSH